jgi:alpha-aminoadipate carrier protein LysW
MTAPATLIGVCPECEAQVALNADTIEGEIVVCAECGVDLEVRGLKPNVVLELAPQEAEDWGE